MQAVFVVCILKNTNQIFLYTCRWNFYIIQQADEREQERADSTGCSNIWTDKGGRKK